MQKRFTDCVSVWLLAVAALAPIMARGAVAPLDELEQRARSSLAMRTLAAELESDARREQLNRGSTGPRLYGATGLADSNEIVDATRNRSFGRITSELGVRIPVLGSRQQIRAANLRSALSLQRRAADIELAKRELIRRLRVAYADYWAAQRLLLLSQEFLENETRIDSILRLRTRAGLMLDADRLEFLSAFELVKRDIARNELAALQSQDSMRAIVDGEIGAGVATRPVVDHQCASVHADAQWLDRDPELEAMTAQLNTLESQDFSPRWQGINSELRVGYQRAAETNTNRTGSAAMIGWSFDVPLEYFTQRGLRTSSATAEAAHARLEWELRRLELRNQFSQLTSRASELAQSLRFAQLRAGAADEAIRERQLRVSHMAGDVMEQLQASRLARYDAAKALVEAERSQLYWHADWARFETESCPAAPVQVAQLSATPAGNRALYLWTSEPWLSGDAEAAARGLARLRQQGIGTLLLSLDAEQIARYAHSNAPLQAFARRAAAAGMRLELLLGEASWIQPQQRPKLLQIVRSLRDAPFAGLHLDLEPNMLDNSDAGAARLLPELLHTLQEVKSVSAWPVSCSLHPRYINAVADGVALGDQLARLGIETTLMIYVANPLRVTEIAKPLVARYPNLRLRVALSLEHTLSRDESLFQLPEAERAHRIALIERSLASENFLGVSLQPSAPWMTAVAGLR